MQKPQPSHSSWQELVASPRRPSHILQIYDSDEFLAAGVGLFAAEGLSRGEAVFLSGTAPHLGDLRRTLRSHGVDIDRAQAREQLVLSSVEDTMAALMVDDMPDAERFRAFGDVLGRASRDPRFSGVRCWGEMSHVLYQRGDTQAALGAERLAYESTLPHGAVLFCSYLLDRFDARAYDGALHEVCACHSHVIPAEDYVRHRMAVNRAIAEVVGEIKGATLQSLLSWKGLGCELPSSQAVLFWLRDALPDRFQDVLSRARAYQLGESSDA